MDKQKSLIMDFYVPTSCRLSFITIINHLWSCSAKYLGFTPHHQTVFFFWWWSKWWNFCCEYRLMNITQMKYMPMLHDWSSRPREDVVTDENGFQFGLSTIDYVLTTDRWCYNECLLMLDTCRKMQLRFKTQFVFYICRDIILK